MSWNKSKFKTLTDLGKKLGEVVETEVKKEEEKLKRFIMILEMKAKHEKRKQDALATETSTRTAD